MKIYIDLNYCYKTIFGMNDIDCTNFFEIRTTSVTRGTHTRFTSVIVHAQ